MNIFLIKEISSPSALEQMNLSVVENLEATTFRVLPQCVE
jgi:hypothetical protein